MFSQISFLVRHFAAENIEKISTQNINTETKIGVLQKQRYYTFKEGNHP